MIEVDLLRKKQTKHSERSRYSYMRGKQAGLVREGSGHGYRKTRTLLHEASYQSHKKEADADKWEKERPVVSRT